MILVRTKSVAPQSSDWRKRAACRGHDTDMFFPERGQNVKPAKEVCHTCPVKKPCLEEALINLDPGIWGETSERQRKLTNKASKSHHPRSRQFKSRVDA